MKPIHLVSKKIMVLSAALGGVSLLLISCYSSGEKGWIHIVSIDDMDFVAYAGGLKTPARIVSYQSTGSEFDPFTSTCPYINHLSFPGYGWSLPWRSQNDMFLICDPQSAPAGSYSGEVTLLVQQIGYSDAQVSFPVSTEIVDASSEPLPGFTQGGGEDIDFFRFLVPAGTPGLTPQVLEIVNQGGGTLNWTLTSDSPWLSVDPYQGDTTTETDIVDVNVNVAGLETEETYFAALYFDCDSPYIAQEKIYVVLTVAP